MPNQPSPQDSAAESMSQLQTDNPSDLLQPPIEHLFLMDPQDLTSENFSDLVAFYRAERLQFNQMENRPKAVRKTRGDPLEGEKAKEKVANVLGLLQAHAREKKEERDG